MKQIILISLLLLGFGLQAQVTYAPDAPEVLDNATTLDIKLDIDIINELAEEQNIFWSIDRTTVTDHDHLTPAEWDFFVCDKITCYAPFITECPADRPSIFDPNETFTFNLHLNPNGIAGIGDMFLHITAEDGTILQSIPVHYEIQGTSSTDALDAKQIKIYPNPTSDYIQIANDNNVATVAIFNIVGKKINTSTHFVGKSHDVSTLQKGIYLVRLIDENQEVLSVFRLNKN